jgi:hypothetical protein
MSTPTATIPPHPDLPDLPQRLRNWAHGYTPVSTGVELLIADGRWLTQPDFIDACVDVFEGYDHRDGLAPMACVRWDQVCRFLRDHIGCPASMARILIVAAELSGTDTGTPLADVVTHLDDTDTALVLDAIVHRAGWPQRQHAHVTNGHLVPRLRPVVGLVDRTSLWGSTCLELPGRLRAWTAVYAPDDSAAVELIVAHGSWLCRHDFVIGCVRWFRDFDATGTPTPMADVVWSQVPGLLADSDVTCTPALSAIAHIATELAGTASGVALEELIADLEDQDLALVLDTIAHAAGFAQRHHYHAVTGRMEARS